MTGSLLGKFVVLLHIDLTIFIEVDVLHLGKQLSLLLFRQLLLFLVLDPVSWVQVFQL